jgi:hypothetical protein
VELSVQGHNHNLGCWAMEEKYNLSDHLEDLNQKVPLLRLDFLQVGAWVHLNLEEG